MYGQKSTILSIYLESTQNGIGCRAEYLAHLSTSSKVHVKMSELSIKMLYPRLYSRSIVLENFYLFFCEHSCGKALETSLWRIWLQSSTDGLNSDDGLILSCFVQWPRGYTIDCILHFVMKLSHRKRQAEQIIVYWMYVYLWSIYLHISLILFLELAFL